MKKICFLVHETGRDILFFNIARAMEKLYQAKAIFLSFSRKSIDYLIEQGIAAEDIVYADIHDWEKEKLDINYIQEAEKKYFSPSLWKYWGTIRSTPFKKHNHALLIMQRQIRFFESYLKDKKPDYIVCDSIASMPSIFLDKIAQYNKILFIQVFESKIQGRFILRRHNNDDWFQVNRKYKELKNRKLTEDEKKIAIDIIDTVVNKHTDYFGMKFLKKKKFFSSRSINLFVSDLISFYKYKKYHFYRQKSKISPFVNLSKIIFHRLRQRYVSFWNPFERPVKGEKFILFPLHFQPEASTLVYAPYYVDQVNLVKALAKSIPVGYKLYVKEHFIGYGRRPLKFFKDVKDFPNIRLIHPRENIHEMIKNASLITVITSTTGWEALLYGKPVLTFGNVFINSCELVTKAPKITELPEKIHGLLNNYKLDKELLQKFIVAIYQASYKGNPLLPNICNNQSLDKDNIIAIAKALNTEIKCKVKNEI